MKKRKARGRVKKAVKKGTRENLTNSNFCVLLMILCCSKKKMDAFIFRIR